jgi:hypothetical protein
VDIEVEDSNSTLEVVREVEVFDVGIEPIDIVLFTSVALGSIIVIVLVVALKKKK